MGIFYDLCMAIDLYNANKKEKKKGLGQFIERKRNEASLKRLINRIFIDSESIDNSLIIDFMNTYNATKETIPIKNLTSDYNEINNILWLKYKNRNSEISIINHNTESNMNRLSVRFEDLTPGTYPISFTLYDKFHYDGIDKKRVAIVKYANEVARTLMKEYCIRRMNR